MKFQWWNNKCNVVWWWCLKIEVLMHHEGILENTLAQKNIETETATTNKHTNDRASQAYTYECVFLIVWIDMLFFPFLTPCLHSNRMKPPQYKPKTSLYKQSRLTLELARSFFSLPSSWGSSKLHVSSCSSPETTAKLSGTLARVGCLSLLYQTTALPILRSACLDLVCSVAFFNTNPPGNKLTPQQLVEAYEQDPLSPCAHYGTSPVHVRIFMQFHGHDRPPSLACWKKIVFRPVGKWINNIFAIWEQIEVLETGRVILPCTSVANNAKTVALDISWRDTPFGAGIDVDHPFLDMFLLCN